MGISTLTKNDDLQTIAGKHIKLLPSGKNGVVEYIKYDDSENTVKGIGIIILKFVGNSVEYFTTGDSGLEYQILS